MRLLPACRAISGAGSGNVTGRVVSLAAFALLSCFLLAFIYQFGSNMPVLDDWDSVALAGRFRDGTLRFSDLFVLHNEHRIFVPSLIMLLNGMLFSLNFKLQMYLSGVLGIILSGLLLASFLELTSGLGEYLGLLVPFILLTLFQAQNYLWGFQIAFLMALFLPVICFYLLRRESGQQLSPGCFITATLLGVVASFSALHGLFVWPAALLLLAGGERKYQFCWVLVGAIVSCGYFYGYESPPNHPPMSLSLNHLKEGLVFLACLVGNLKTGSYSDSQITGSLFLLLFPVFFFMAPDWGKSGVNAFWRATALFSFLTLAAVAAGRAGFGLEMAFSSRYVTFTALFLVAVLALGVSTAASVPRMKWILAVMVAVVTLSLPMSYMDGFDWGLTNRDESRGYAKLLSSYKTAACEELLSVFAEDCQVVQQRAPILEALGHEIFRQPGR